MVDTGDMVPEEFYVVVDVEASGPSPGQYALLSIGACTLGQPPQTFYVELQPDRAGSTTEAMAVHGMSLTRLAVEGQPPSEAMRAFADWIAQVVPQGARAVFVALNAPFDWMFINDYFHRYLGHNPFGHAALDIKAYYMGLHGVPWEETSYSDISRRYRGVGGLMHHALDDAIDEASMFRGMLAEQMTDREGEKG